jgi:hypothetical protein
LKTNQRHHSAHPPTAVKPNSAVNPKPEAYAPVEQAARPNVNPSLPGPVGVDPVNARAPRIKAPEAAEPDDDCVDPGDPACDDRKKVSPSFAY